jgi:hypothetical protein
MTPHEQSYLLATYLIEGLTADYPDIDETTLALRDGVWIYEIVLIPTTLEDLSCDRHIIRSESQLGPFEAVEQAIREFLTTRPAEGVAA